MVNFDEFLIMIQNIKENPLKLRQIKKVLKIEEKSFPPYKTLQAYYYNQFSIKSNEEHKIKWVRKDKILFIWTVMKYFEYFGRQEITPVSYFRDLNFYIRMMMIGVEKEILNLKWLSLLKANLKLAPWHEDEDQILREIIDVDDNKNNWLEIAVEFNKRNPQQIIRHSKQIKERWNNYINPNLKKSEWSVDEQIRLLREISQIGKKWSRISIQMNGRNENQTKNQYNSIMNSYKRENPHSLLNEEQIVLRILEKLEESRDKAFKEIKQKDSWKEKIEILSEKRDRSKKNIQNEMYFDNVDQENKKERKNKIKISNQILEVGEKEQKAEKVEKNEIIEKKEIDEEQQQIIPQYNYPLFSPLTMNFHTPLSYFLCIEDNKQLTYLEQQSPNNGLEITKQFQQMQEDVKKNLLSEQLRMISRTQFPWLNQENQQQQFDQRQFQNYLPADQSYSPMALQQQKLFQQPSIQATPQQQLLLQYGQLVIQQLFLNICQYNSPQMSPFIFQQFNNFKLQDQLINQQQQPQTQQQPQFPPFQQQFQQQLGQQQQDEKVEVNQNRKKIKSLNKELLQFDNIK